MNVRKRNNVEGYAFLMPALIILGLFLFLPTILSVYYAFTDYYMLTPNDRQFIWLENFKQLFSDRLFIQSLKNIAKFVILIMPIQVGTALVLALIVNKQRKGNIIFKVAFFAPVVMSLVVISVLWMYLLNPTDGLINAVLERVGLDPQPFLSSPTQAMYVIVGVSAWQGAGYQMLIFLAGLQNIPAEYYEAAKIDGANWWDQFTKITLPLLKPTSVLILTTTLIDAFKLIVQPMVMTQGGPLNSTLTPVYYIYRTGFTDRQVGYASAITVVYGGIIILFTIVQRMITGGNEDE